MTTLISHKHETQHPLAVLINHGFSGYIKQRIEKPLYKRDKVDVFITGKLKP